MHQEIINTKTKRVFSTLIQNNLIQDFYLGGGTALALQLRHRESIDLDWFNQENFDINKLKDKLKKLGNITVESEEENTLNIVLDGVKLSFLGYKYKILFPILELEEAKIADYRDIACMKLDAVSSRGAKKDFIDLYFILKKHSLSELLKMFEKKYSDIKYNKLHLLKSLDYFADADKDPMPIMFKKVAWSDIKKSLTKTIQNNLK